MVRRSPDVASFPIPSEAIMNLNHELENVLLEAKQASQGDSFPRTRALSANHSIR